MESIDKIKLAHATALVLTLAVAFMGGRFLLYPVHLTLLGFCLAVTYIFSYMLYRRQPAQKKRQIRIQFLVMAAVIFVGALILFWELYT